MNTMVKLSASNYLISTHVLDKEGYGNYFHDGKWRLSKGSLVFARGKICCTLHLLVLISS